jgi:OOP family OmpA-OmpF porin
VVIEGHTDNTGSPDYNLRLSQLRADSVRSFLIANGIAPLRMQAIGFGETRPEAPNDNAAGRQQNRRVEIVIQDVEPIVRASGG